MTGHVGGLPGDIWVYVYACVYMYTNAPLSTDPDLLSRPCLELREPSSRGCPAGLYRKYSDTNKQMLWLHRAALIVWTVCWSAVVLGYMFKVTSLSGPAPHSPVRDFREIYPWGFPYI